MFFNDKEPVKITYHSYKYFNELIFRKDLINSPQNCVIFLQVLNADAPIKEDCEGQYSALSEQNFISGIHV